MTHLLITLPDAPAVDAAVDWWLVADDGVIDRGTSKQWLALCRTSGATMPITGLTPSSRVRMAFAPRAEGVTSDRQAIAVARLEAFGASLGDQQTLHSAGALVADGEATLTALVANDAMLQWLDWAERLNISLDHIVPSALVLPLGEPWVTADLGRERVAGHDGLVIPAEPALLDALAEGDVHSMSPDEIDAAFVALAQAPLIDLRSGRFVKRKRFIIDRARIRELVMLAAAIPLITLLYALVLIAQLEQSTSELDAKALAAARSVAGNSVTLETAEAAVAARSTGSANAFAVPLSALLIQVQAQPNLSSTQLAYGSDGTLSTTLAAPTYDAINRVLLALQRDGYRVTAVRRQGTDGRLMADITIRSGP